MSSPILDPDYPNLTPERSARNRAISLLRRNNPSSLLTNAEIATFINANPELFPELNADPPQAPTPPERANAYIREQYAKNPSRQPFDILRAFIRENPELFSETDLNTGHLRQPSLAHRDAHRALFKLSAQILAHAPEEPKFTPTNVTDTNEVIRKTVAYVRYLEQKLYEIENEISNS